MADQIEKPLVVSGIGRVEVARYPCGGSTLVVWNESADEPDEPYLRFDQMHTCEGEEPDTQKSLPRARWTVTSGDGLVVLTAGALPPKEVIGFLLSGFDPDDETDEED